MSVAAAAVRTGRNVDYDDNALNVRVATDRKWSPEVHTKIFIPPIDVANILLKG